MSRKCGFIKSVKSGQVCLSVSSLSTEPDIQTYCHSSPAALHCSEPSIHRASKLKHPRILVHVKTGLFSIYALLENLFPPWGRYAIAKSSQNLVSGRFLCILHHRRTLLFAQAQQRAQDHPCAQAMLMTALHLCQMRCFHVRYLHVSHLHLLASADVARVHCNETVTLVQHRLSSEAGLLENAW